MKRSLALLPAVLVAGCAGPGQLYEWGSYQPALLDYTKTSESGKFEEELRETIAKGEKRDFVPPGVYAELGYLLMHTDRPAEAAILFGKEKEHFPESAVLMDKMIAGASKANEGEAADAT